MQKSHYSHGVSTKSTPNLVPRFWVTYICKMGASDRCWWWLFENWWNVFADSEIMLVRLSDLDLVQMDLESNGKSLEFIVFIGMYDI